MPTSGPGSPRRRAIFYGVSAALVVATIATFRAVLVPFLLALVVAYVLSPVVDALARVRVGKVAVPRGLAVLVVYITLLAILAGAIAWGAPRLLAEAQRLARALPEIVRHLETDWGPRLSEWATAVGVGSSSGGGASPAEALNGVVTRMLSTGESHAGSLLASLQNVVKAIVSGIFTFSMTLMVSAYLLFTRDRVLAFFRGLVPQGARDGYDALVTRMDRGLSGVVRGQVVICLVNGALSAVGFALMHVPYWPVLAIVATVLSLIPIFGSILSSIPAVALALHNGFGSALGVLAWIVGIHQLEANLLNPKIMGDAAKVHPVLVIFSLLAGEHFFGAVGALLAVPCLSIVQSLFVHFRQVALADE